MRQMFSIAGACLEGIGGQAFFEGGRCHSPPPPPKKKNACPPIAQTAHSIKSAMREQSRAFKISRAAADVIH